MAWFGQFNRNGHKKDYRQIETKYWSYYTQLNLSKSLNSNLVHEFSWYEHMEYTLSLLIAENRDFYQVNISTSEFTNLYIWFWANALLDLR